MAKKAKKRRHNEETRAKMSVSATLRHAKGRKKKAAAASLRHSKRSSKRSNGRAGGEDRSGMNPNIRVLKGGFRVRIGRFVKTGPDATAVHNVPTKELQSTWKKYERDRLFFERGGRNKVYKTRRKGAQASRRASSSAPRQ